jgi:hypothetical protein
MSEPRPKYHNRIDLERFDSFYADVAERDYNHHSNVTSPFDVWSVCRLRSKCDLQGARTIPTDVVVWGRGSGPHIATTRVGGVPAWSPRAPLPSGLQFLGQFNLSDSADILPFATRGLLSVWVSEEFPWERGSVKTFWVDPESADLAPEFEPSQRYVAEEHEPYFGSLYRSWDPDPKHKFEPVAVDHQFEAYREYKPRSWDATKYGGLEHMPQRGSKFRFRWRFLFQFASIQASPKVAWPWTTREEPLTLRFDEGGIYHDSNSVVTGDMGVISFSGTKNGQIKTLFECG